MLYSMVTDKEIKDALFIIGQDKVVGLDRFNAFFFKHIGGLLKRIY